MTFIVPLGRWVAGSSRRHLARGQACLHQQHVAIGGEGEAAAGHFRGSCARMGKAHGSHFHWENPIGKEPAAARAGVSPRLPMQQRTAFTLRLNNILLVTTGNGR